MRSWKPTGAVIGKVEIDIRNIFDKNDPARTRALQTRRPLARPHKPATIGATALFKSGDRTAHATSPKRSETCALLVFIYDARVVPVRFVDGKVDVRVITRDVWTFDPTSPSAAPAAPTQPAPASRRRTFWVWGKQCRSDTPATSTAPARRSRTRTRTCSARTGPRLSPTSIRATEASAWPHSASLFIPSIRGGARRWSGKPTIAPFPAIISATSSDQFNDNETPTDRRRILQRARSTAGPGVSCSACTTIAIEFLPTPIDELAGQAGAPGPRTLSYPFVGFDIVQDKYGKAGDENQIGKTEDLYFGRRSPASSGIPTRPSARTAMRCWSRAR